MNYILLDNGKKIELSDVAIPVDYNYSSGTLDDFEDGDSNDITKQFQIKGTAQINSIFNGLFDLKDTSHAVNFDPTLRVPATLYISGSERMRGVLMVRSVTRLREDVTYNVIFISDGADLFLSASEVKLSELDWSDITHTFTKSNVMASWANPAPKYFYGLIHRGRQRQSARSFTTEDFGLYLYTTDILDRLMAHLNVPYTSNFFSQQMVSENLLYGYGGLLPSEVNQNELNDRYVDFEQNATDADLKGSGMSSTWSSVYLLAPSKDFSKLTNGADKAEFQYLTHYNITDPSNQFYLGAIYAHQGGMRKVLFNHCVFKVKFDDSGITPINDTVSMLPKAHIAVSVNYQQVGKLELTPTWNGSDTVTFIQTGNEVEFNTNPNDVITFALKLGGSITFDNYTSDSVHLTYSLSSVIEQHATDIGLGTGVTVKPFFYIPDMTGADFLKELRKMFCLEIKEIDGVHVIEPYNSFYLGTSNTEDISHFVDRSKKIDIIPISNEESKRVVFSTAELEETDSEDYKRTTGHTYGEKTVTQGSYYAKGDTSIERITAPIIPVEIPNENGNYTNVITEARLIKIENGKGKLVKAIPRICFKTISTSNGSDYIARLSDMDGTNNGLIQEIGLLYDSSPFGFLHYQIPSIKYHSLLVVSTSAFTDFWLRKLNEFIGNEARKLVCYLNLSNYDRQQLDIRKYKNIDGSVWRLVSIDGFDENKVGSYKATFIKVVDSFGFPPLKLFEPDKTKATTNGIDGGGIISDGITVDITAVEELSLDGGWKGTTIKNNIKLDGFQSLGQTWTGATLSDLIILLQSMGIIN